MPLYRPVRVALLPATPMTLQPLDLLIIAAYGLITLGLGFWVSRRASRNLKSYFLGGE